MFERRVLTTVGIKHPFLKLFYNKRVNLFKSNIYNFTQLEETQEQTQVQAKKTTDNPSSTPKRLHLIVRTF